jgi:hypothetical protein
MYSNTFVAIVSNIPFVQFNVGKELISIDKFVHLITTSGKEEILIHFDCMYWHSVEIDCLSLYVKITYNFIQPECCSE